MDLYAQSHLFLHPSETPPDENQEGIPNSILEAMATGLPVAATRHGGIPEAVEHGRSGLLVEERDFEALANAMQEITRSPGIFREMGLLGHEYVAANFEQAAQIRQLELHYDETVALTVERKRAPAVTRRQIARLFRRAGAGEIAFVRQNVSRAKIVSCQRDKIRFGKPALAFLVASAWSLRPAPRRLAKERGFLNQMSFRFHLSSGLGVRALQRGSAAGFRRGTQPKDMARRKNITSFR